MNTVITMHETRSRSMSRDLESLKFFSFSNLSTPLVRAGKWLLILKLQHNISILSGQIFDICLSFCFTRFLTWKCKI